MKKVLIALSLLALSACGGGFDDLDAARAGGGGIGSTITPSPNPNNPEIQTRWQYSATEIEGTIISVRANNGAVNSYVDPITNARRTPTLALERQLVNNLERELVTIFAGSSVACVPSCDINIRFDGRLSVFRMQSSGDGILTPIDINNNTALFRNFTSSNIAIVSLPIVGFSGFFDAEFDLRGYDASRMIL